MNGFRRMFRLATNSVSTFLIDLPPQTNCRVASNKPLHTWHLRFESFAPSLFSVFKHVLQVVPNLKSAQPSVQSASRESEPSADEWLQLTVFSPVWSETSFWCGLL